MDTEASGSEAPASEAGASGAVATDARSVDVLSSRPSPGNWIDWPGSILSSSPIPTPVDGRPADELAQAGRPWSPASSDAFDTPGQLVPPDGARTASAWLSVRCRIPKAEARRQVRRGRALPALPEVEQAWSKVVTSPVPMSRGPWPPSAPGPETEEALARDEALLVGQACHLRFDQFVQAVAYWKQLADPEGADAEAEARRARRDVYLVTGFAGSWLGAMTLDPISGAIVSTELERLEHDLFEAEWAEARDALGHDPTPGELLRTPGQRRADALVEMATRSKSAPQDARRPAPLFTVLVGYETLHGRICQLEDGTVVPPGALLPWLDRADLERAVCSPRPPGRDRPPGPAYSPGPPGGPSRCGTASAPTPTAMWWQTLPGRPHPALGPRWPHHPGERAVAVSGPQPQAKPSGPHQRPEWCRAALTAGPALRRRERTRALRPVAIPDDRWHPR